VHYDPHVHLSEFDFELPESQIAQAPPERGTSRLLVLDRKAGTWRHQRVADLPTLLRAGDLLVVNDSRVVPARLLGHRDPSGGQVECLLLRHRSGDEWDVLLHPGQKMKPGTRARFGDGPRSLELEVLSQHTFGRRTVRLRRADAGDLDEAVDELGHMPLPPYIKRPDSAADRERYQTVYARARGSIAAPTAGLHLTPALLADLAARGIERADITLHVGYGTFSPIRVDEIEAHRIDPEIFEVSEGAAAAIARARDDGRRVIAVGTTTTRTLESVAHEHRGRVEASAGETDLFIYPGFHFRVLGGLLTNFHLPQSSLLVLVCAFAGRELVLDAYRDAVKQGYRFYSYGDAMLVL
jgi:S-adenosylmethionine:tRNA ribosyltransferase-isomerase